MKKIFSILPLSLIFICSNILAQAPAAKMQGSTTDWISLMKDGNSNFYDVQNAFNNWYATQPHPEMTAGEDEEENGNYLLFKRWEWYMAPRVYPSGKLPNQQSLANEYKAFLNTHAAESKTVHQITASSNWSYIGNTSAPSNTNVGRVNRVRFDPTNSNTIYACAASGGLWKSTNGGTSWSTKTDKLLALGTSDVAIDPTNTNIMYLATGDGDGVLSYYGAPTTMGVLKSTDGGNTWNPTSLYYTLQTSGPSYITVNQLIIDPTNPSILMAAASIGLYYTRDGGLSWYLVLSGNFKSIEFAPGNSSIAYAATASDQFYRSTDGGQNFSQVTLPSSTSTGRLQIGVSPANANYVYVLGGDKTTNAYSGVWLSTDQGATFALQSSSPNLLGWKSNGSDNSGQQWYDLAIAVDPTNASNVMVGGVQIWRSTNAGVSWTLNADWTGTRAAYVHSDIHHILFYPTSSNAILAACDGGVFKTTNTGPNWGDISSNLEISQQYSIGLSASNANIWLTGWQDNGTIRDNAGTFDGVIGGDGMTCFVDYSNNNYMYGTSDGDFQISSNGGNSFKSIGITTTETENWVPPFVQDPSNSQTLYAGFENVWKTTNRGTNWSKISSFGTAGAALVSMAVAPSNDKYIYAAQNAGLYTTTNGGTTWTSISSGLPTSSGYITDVIVDPANPLRVWVSFSGYNSGVKIYQTVTGGTSWKNISAGLPNLPVNCLVYQTGGAADAMYAGTDVGVYFRDTTDTKGTWVSYNTGLPDVMIADLKIYAPGNLLRAATYGRGDWQTPLYTSPAVKPVVNFRGYPTTICASYVVQFFDSSANSPTAWTWTFAGGNPATSTAQNPNVQYSTAGKYSVKLVASNAVGKDSNTYNNYITVNALPAAPAITQSSNHDTLTCTPSNMPYYQWFLSNAMIPGANSYQYYPVTTKGNYKVTITDSAGCSLSATHNITLVGINEISLDRFVSIFPNPSSGNVEVALNLPENGVYNLTVTDVLGQTVYAHNLTINGAFTTQLNLSGYGKGIYFLSLVGDNSRTVKKIIIY